MTPRILVISFSKIASDARVLREISVVAKHGHVTTVGYGPKPAGSDEHLQLPDKAVSLPQTPLGVLKLALRMHKSVELDAPGTRAALALIGDRTFDLVIANDARALPLAFAVRGQAPVWADLHEWAPEERTHVTSWRLLVAPFMDYACKTYLPQTAAQSTVGEEIASLYRERYGVTPRLVRNMAPFADLEPSPMREDGVIRLVHSGGAVFGRNIEAMIAGAVDAGDKVTLDLYLIPANDGGAYLRKLKEIAGDNPRITFHGPVKPDELPATLNAYDVGIFWIPPFNTNARLTLPNKIFDFIQARLAVAVGPTVEMARLVKRYGLGLVTEDFEHDTIVNAIQSLTREQVEQWKRASAACARELSFENESRTIDSIINELLGGSEPA